ncbi:MAG: DUF1987 domain-containing protein [Bacillota bacterium]|nr:DUF1987 domain-containing protein [Bacillota bacterium]
MERLFIDQAKATPQIDFDMDTRILIIKGQSYPENAFKFYEPVFNWLDDFLTQIQDERQIRLELSLPYVNTSSSKCIMMLLEKFEEAKEQGRNILINWYYDKDNESELECAEEFKEFVDLEFNLIPC